MSIVRTGNSEDSELNGVKPSSHLKGKFNSVLSFQFLYLPQFSVVITHVCVNLLGMYLSKSHESHVLIVSWRQTLPDKMEINTNVSEKPVPPH